MAAVRNVSMCVEQCVLDRTHICLNTWDMKEGPDITLIASMIGDTARANMLIALMSGKALTAGELAYEAGITPQTASSHLRKLESAGLITPKAQGRHKYFALAGQDVAHTIEALIGLAQSRGHLRTRTGPRDPALREARVCYDHLAGATAVQIYDSMVARKFLALGQGGVTLSPTGKAFVTDLGATLPKATKRPLCRACLDWSERRDHLAGGLGAALLTLFQDKDWVRRPPEGRIVTITDVGQQQLQRLFPI